MLYRASKLKWFLLLLVVIVYNLKMQTYFPFTFMHTASKYKKEKKCHSQVYKPIASWILSEKWNSSNPWIRKLKRIQNRVWNLDNFLLLLQKVKEIFLLDEIHYWGKDRLQFGPYSWYYGCKYLAYISNHREGKWNSNDRK